METGYEIQLECPLVDDMKSKNSPILRPIDWLKNIDQFRILSITAVILALVDTFITSISLTALALLAIAFLPLLITLINSSEWPLKSMKLPGGVELEFSDLKRIGEEAASAGLLKQTEHDKYSFQSIYEKDPNLAMAGLRIELEGRLRKLGEIEGINASRGGIDPLMRSLEGTGALSHEENSVIADLVPTLNRAVHADNLDPRAFDWAMDVGPQLLAALDIKIQDKKPL